MNKKINALDAGISLADAFLVADSDRKGDLTYAYYAEETESYWLVTEAALVALGEGGDLTIWAENDDTAKEFGRRSPRRRS